MKPKTEQDKAIMKWCRYFLRMDIKSYISQTARKLNIKNRQYVHGRFKKFNK
jgi:hypothetical protein